MTAEESAAMDRALARSMVPVETLGSVELREPQTPHGWEYWPEKPMHSMSVYHRGRIVDGIWRCWDCPSTHDVEYKADRQVETKGDAT